MCRIPAAAAAVATLACQVAAAATAVTHVCPAAAAAVCSCSCARSVPSRSALVRFGCLFRCRRPRARCGRRCRCRCAAALVRAPAQYCTSPAGRLAWRPHGRPSAVSAAWPVTRPPRDQRSAVPVPRRGAPSPARQPAALRRRRAQPSSADARPVARRGDPSPGRRAVLGRRPHRGAAIRRRRAAVLGRRPPRGTAAQRCPTITPVRPRTAVLG